MRCLPALALAVILLSPGPAAAQALPAPGLPDPSGLWRTVHPRPDWGEVLVQFHPLYGGVRIGDRDWPCFHVSLWKPSASGPVKLRDGLFGDRTRAALVFADGALSFAWLGDDPSAPLFDPVTRLEPGRLIEFGTGETLAWEGGPTIPPPFLLPPPELPGIYAFDHEAAGSFHVLLQASPDGTCTVRTVRELPGLGWALAGEGLFGGSRPGGGFTRVRAELRDGQPVLAWYAPGADRPGRTDRIACIYPDGDLGLGPVAGDSRHAQEYALDRVAGPGARVGRPSEILDFGGLYEYRSAGAGEPVLLEARRDGVTADGLPAWRLDRVRKDGDALAILGPGLSDRDIFTRVAVIDDDGRCLLRFMAPGEGFMETLEAVLVLPDGGFSLRGLAPPVAAALTGAGETEAPIVASLTRLSAPAASSRAAPGSAVASPALGRDAALGKALAVWEALPAEARRRWEAFSGWSASLTGAKRPANLEEAGFAMPGGTGSPAAEFAAFAAECLCAPPYKDGRSHAAWRLPDRYRFVLELFPELAASPPPFAGQPGFRDWVDPERVESVELVVTTPASSSIASVAGHSLLLLRRTGDSPDGSDSLVLGFVGETALDRAAGVSGLAYAWRGLTGAYRSATAEETLESLARRANFIENRDVLRFSLSLSRDETTRLVERLWVLSRTFSGAYRFFSANCAGMLMDALAVACPDDANLRAADPVMAPMLVLGRLAAAGRIRGSVQPGFPSPGARSRRAAEGIDALERRILALAPVPLRRNLAAALALGRDGAGAVLDDGNLFREPVPASAPGGRASAYGAIASLCDDACEAEPGAPPAEFAELVLRWLYIAFDREIFLAVPDDPELARARGDGIPGEPRRAWAERAAWRIRTRQENSQELAALRAATSRLRLYADDRYPGADIYGLAARLERERMAAQAAALERAAYTHGYFRSGFALGVGLSPDAPSAAVSWRGSVYLGEMGDGSACALKPDLRLEIGTLSIGLSLSGGAEASMEAGLRAFRLEKLLTPDGPEHGKTPVPGFGIALLDLGLHVGLGGERTALPRLEADVAEAGFILNLARSGEYRACLNLGAWAGYRLECDGAAFRHLLVLPLRLEAKLPFGGRDDGALGLEAAWLPDLGADGLDPSAWSFTVRLDLGLADRGNAMLGLELDLGGDPSCSLRVSW